MAEEPAPPPEHDPKEEIARLKADAAPAYALAYVESRLALDGPELALGSIRTRAETS